MSEHLSTFGAYPVGQICLPGSHDAGTYKLERSTAPGGTRSNVITQTLSIYQQLEHGVRWFDIRPFLIKDSPGDAGTWRTGHFSPLGGVLDWQGGCGASIDEVINDINNFTKDHSELIILDVSHVTHLLLETKGKGLDLTVDHRRDLLDKFTAIKHVFSTTADPEHVVLHDLPLTDFIGHGEAAVVLLFDDGFDRGELHRRGFYHSSRYSVYNHYITLAQDDMAAVLSTLNPFQVFGPGANNYSVLKLTESHQRAEFPLALQNVAGSAYPSVLTIDNVLDDDLLTLSLAISFQRYNIAHGLRNKVIVYGARLIVDPGAHQRLQECIDAPRGFPISNENLGSDPWLGLKKSCAIFYWQDGWAKGRYAKEHSSLHLEQDIKSIEYGGSDVKNQGVYYRFYRALVERGGVRINNDNLGGDPKVGHRKKCKVRYREFNGKDTEEYEVDEDRYLDFKTFWERFAESQSSHSQW
ncbi:PLC-like phosphodiesterase [Dichomitus squalens LYAD-421 SS1]|uniref:PLC-like phosphodiesterase n=1 Tax=Dichomitus squalens (strain LYAD-421) TaxID=732165 RepID=UPI00044148EC|nr:PLC-like phosphodiesterase [Dichomitus squalens LYAD-421 SS1]EJF64505.1 PLC-like phosphodiesterase [Dichomitus squalens LYAD-421 SS1]